MAWAEQRYEASSPRSWPATTLPSISCSGWPDARRSCSWVDRPSQVLRGRSGAGWSSTLGPGCGLVKRADFLQYLSTHHLTLKEELVTKILTPTQPAPVMEIARDLLPPGMELVVVDPAKPEFYDA